MKTKIGLVITTYNRPEELQTTLNSLSKSIFPKDFEIFIVDDCSSDPKTWELVTSFNIVGINIIKVRNDKNQGMFYGLKMGFDYFQKNNFDVLMNLDSDTIVKPYWINAILRLHKWFPDSIVSGFNTSKHQIFESFPQYHTKLNIGGINIAFGVNLCPLVCSVLESNKWDWKLCNQMRAFGKKFITAKPSVVQHIAKLNGSSIGHNSTLDLAEDWIKQKICIKDNIEFIPHTKLNKHFTKVKKIMFVQATRGRPIKGIEAALRITKTMKSQIPFTYYFSIDTDDPTLSHYLSNISKLDFVTDVIIGDNKGCVDATNRGATKYTDEDLIIVSGDDMAVRTLGWDMYVLNFIENNIATDEYMLHFPDETANSREIAIYQFLSGPLYKKLGWIFYPEYISMYGDNDLWATCTQLGAIYNYTTPPNPYLFYHDHPNLGGSMTWDNTYERTNRPICYEMGRKIYSRRQQEKFPIK